LDPHLFRAVFTLWLADEKEKNRTFLIRVWVWTVCHGETDGSIFCD